MLAGIARSAAVAAIAVPLVALAAPSASANQPETSRPVAANADQPLLSNVDAPYISINICVHIPTPGSATLDWCWP
ncbi:hypothetical protein ACWDUL_17530 [Nocardia niigatensis]|uniref:hypothetical protein n=1 Tax=Nocardia niigatensis TaxID=209249 RepID=UPI000319E886|nr:hypothetical protein [Nocardia niigatensis]